MFDVRFEKKQLFSVRAGYYIIPVFEGVPASFFNAFGEAAAGLRRFYAEGGIRTAYRKNTVLTLRFKSGVKKILIAGLGRRKKLDAEKIRQACGAALKEAKGFGVETIAMGPWFEKQELISAQAEGTMLAAYAYGGYLKAEDGILKRIIFASTGTKAVSAIKEIYVTARNVFLARDLMNAPGNLATPLIIERKAREAAKGKKRLKVRAFGYKEAKKLGMGAFCAVARGSDELARFIIMEYKGGKKGAKPAVFIGKGITFDSGGISLKPQSSGLSKIEEMRFDMSGAAVVLYLMKALAELKIRINAVALLPATENLPSGRAYKPGDVLKTYSGKTVEVISTDAEGRLVLCDAMAYAVKKYKPRFMADIATLTGACVIALGRYAIGLMGNNEKLINVAKQAGEVTGERVWQLPLWDDYLELMKSRTADLKNAGNGEAGTITAGIFLKQFAGRVPWVHLDIAGTAYNVRNKTYAPDGVTGCGLRLLLEFTKEVVKKSF